jgi:ClpP class serine protease
LREDGIEYKNLDEEEREEIRKMHKRFYDEIKKNVKKEFFGDGSENFIKFKYNE